VRGGPLPRGTRAGLVAAVAALGAGGWMIYAGAHTEAPPRPSVADAVTSRADSAEAAAPTTRAPAPTPDVEPMEPSPPTRIRIPRIGVDAPVMGLGADRAGHLQVPPKNNRNLAGWYRDGPSPGSIGNAIIDGHVDTLRGRAVFYALGALHKGDTIAITRADRSTAKFSVYGIEVYAKNAFPGKRVYGATPKPELRLITCGGGYTKATGYQGNVVVYARLVKAVPAPGD
jgi:sortase (surface protein transpeptidase)